MQKISRYFSSIVLLFFSTCSANENTEQNYLRNIKQVTFPHMGFEKAGESYFSPDSKTLIFQAVPKGKKQYQIYTIDIENGKPKMVSTGYGACTCAYFHPDGKKVIFASSHASPEKNENAPGYQRDNNKYVWEFTPYMNIYQANSDGSDLKPLTTGSAYSAECAYSSDGSHVVFASNRSGHMNLYTMNADGSHVQQLTFDENVYNGGPFFSPDMSKLVYRADHKKQHYLQIYSIDIATKEKKQLTINDAVNWAPYWHPNGNCIVFTTSLHGHHQYELYLLNVTTNKLQRLTHHEGFDGLATFNKDGTKITWTSKRGPDNTCQIFVADFVLPKEMK